MKNHQFYSLLFWLNKTRGKNDKKAIYLRMTINKKRVEFSTHQYVNPGDWNKHRQRLNQKAIDVDSVNRILDVISKYLTSHTARHTFATTVTLENDMPIETVSQMLGHRSIRTTQIYAKITQSKVSNNMKVLKEKLSTITQAKKGNV